IVIIMIPVSYYFISDSETIKKKAEPDINTVRTKEIVNDKQANIIPVTQIRKSPSPLLSIKDITLLIKITDKSELKQLLQFVHLFELSTEYTKLLNQVIKTKNKSLTISKEKPLYVFQTALYSGLFISKNNQLSDNFILHIEKIISYKPDNKDFCAIKRDIQFINTKNYLFISSNNTPDISKKINDLSKDKQLTKQFLKFDALFAQIEKKPTATFNFYYSKKADSSMSDFSLSSNNNTFWLNTDSDYILDHFKINKNKINTRALLKKLNLFHLSLLLIAQDKTAQLSAKKVQDLNFKPEAIISLKKNYSIKAIKAIKDYQKELDIEFNAQWQSGPFAITTNKFIFDKKLIIELLAKGQNIDNLMEYSHTSSIITQAVINNKGDNILYMDCADKQSNKAIFKDHEGEQEAYINDDFISYRAITASNQVTLKPDSNSKISDIAVIKGVIKLQLAESVLNKTIDSHILKSLKQQNTQQFDQFVIHFDAQKEKNSLNYTIIGGVDKFITLRSYNKSGEILDTLALNKQSKLNKQVTSYHQVFSDTIAGIKVFYSSKNNILFYPFALKPSIAANTTPLNGQDTAEINFDQTTHMEKLERSTLDNGILQDNPAWLGEKIAQTTQLPFYINLFTRDDNEKESISDAVLNIKTALSPFISQNLSAVKLSLSEGKNTLLDNFISFTINEQMDGEAIMDSDAQATAPQLNYYLNSNSAFQINKNRLNTLHGKIILNLPTSFKTYTNSFSLSRQSIKSDKLMVTLAQIDKHQVQFKIKGDIEKLVQLKLYNQQEKLISEPFDFKHINNDSALLTLRYNDEIDSIKLIAAQKAMTKNYTFSFKTE
ncbi:MAG: hypothetical protein GQ546_09145, partial [Gammaproteobacteria bacterium]|nr:hypothetical protein [Gammaproteobacteria bacterium]